MTVIIPVGKLSRKIAIPLLLFILIVIVGIWFIPESLLLFKILTTIASFCWFVGTLCWTIWGDI